MTTDGVQFVRRETSATKDGFSTSPIERRTTPSTYSSSTGRYSIGSNDTGESSGAGSQRSSLATNTVNDEKNDEPVVVGKDGKSYHRSHRSKHNAGFLLSNSLFDRAATKSDAKTASTHVMPLRDTIHVDKGKGKLKTPTEKNHKRSRSNVGLGIGGSPLASHVTNAGANGDFQDEQSAVRGQNGMVAVETQQKSNPLDVDSAQIVNLALNLSESRRNAARRNVSVPLALGGGLTEGTAGSSLKQHLQQQRRASRNISPKPDRGDRAATASPRLVSGQKLNSPLQAAFESADVGYTYHFSASTLARAQKAKTAIELMAQYRRLLQYVPPLNSLRSDHSSAASMNGNAPVSPVGTTSSSAYPISNPASIQVLGRPYNPLQYIRNRKVRARERKAIDGESQGFGDLEQVSAWIDEISNATLISGRPIDGPLPAPNFSQLNKDAASPHASPPSLHGRRPATTNVRRPRNDWTINAADMIADVFWGEHEENRRLIEDREGRRILSGDSDVRRPVSQSREDSQPKKPSVNTTTPDLRIDTKSLPEFKSVKPESERYHDHAISKAKVRLLDATRGHHGRNGSKHEHRTLSQIRSDSESSDSDDSPRHRRRRSGTADSREAAGRDILEKQMAEMLAKEAQEAGSSQSQVSHRQKLAQSIETQDPMVKEIKKRPGTQSAEHSRSASRIAKKHSKRDSLRGGSSGRPSLEVPRSSFEGFDSTAPSSPETRATQTAGFFIPTFGMELSPSSSRRSSPTRNPISRVRSKINMLHDRNRSYSRERTAEEEYAARSSMDTPERKDSSAVPERLARAKSPVKNLVSRRTDDGQIIPSRAGSIKGKNSEDASGIRGLFKSGRGAVAKVSEVLWKKDSSLGPGFSSGFTTDESDTEDVDVKGSPHDQANNEPASPKAERQSFLASMPTFTSPFDRRGRERVHRTETTGTEDEYTQRQHQAREERKAGTRLTGPPRIDVQDASPRESSPNARPRGRERLESDTSDLASFRETDTEGISATDARLNAILGLPGKSRDQLPITGLSKFDTTHKQRPSLEGRRQWSISDRGVSVNHGLMTKKEIARVRALLLSSGVKAKEIHRRAFEIHDLSKPHTRFSEIVALSREPVEPIPRLQEHILAAEILSKDFTLSTRALESSLQTFYHETRTQITSRAEMLQARIVQNLTPMARKAADDADEVSRELVTSHTLAVKRLSDMMDRMLRRRRRRFRWLRRGGWVLLEWALVGIMWYVWFMVMLCRIFLGLFKGLFTFLRWLLWL